MLTEAHQAQAAGLHYERRGEGPPLLLLHGLGGERGVWDPVLESLAAQRDVIACDLPGFGSSAPLADGEVPTCAALADAVARFLDALGLERVHVAGNSLGAWVGLELALLGRARTVTAIAPAGLWGKPLKDREDKLARAVGRRLLPLAPLLFRNRPLRALFFRWSVAHPERLAAAVAVRMARNYLRAPAFTATDLAMRRGRFTGEAGLTVPVTIAWCEYDRQVSPPRRELPWATILTLENVGHMPMSDDPELVTRTILEGSSE